jgi:DMSO/TMAO reductase YedYZ molybdopterin-dependent catalytic subunit
MERIMNATVEDLRPTIIPKSDQLNAEQLLGGPITVTVSDVRVSDSGEQPVVVHYVGEDGRPFKPCKTMRKVLIHAWGTDGRKWIGRSMTLYNDPSVKFGGDDVGGIRISHMTDIERDVKVSLTSTRGKKAKYEIKRLAASAPPANKSRVTLEQVITGLNSATSPEELLAAAERAKSLAGDEKAKAGAAYTARLHELKAAAQNVDRSTGEVIDHDDESLKQVEQTIVATFAQVADKLNKAQNIDELGEAADLIQHVPDYGQRDELGGIYKNRAAEFKAQ